MKISKKKKPVNANKNIKRIRKPIKASTDLSNPYIRIFLTNLGKYNEGELVGEWVELPVTDDFRAAKEAIGINSQYEEWFITDYETNIPGLTIGEYDNIEKLNELASEMDDMSEDQLIIMSVRMENGESFDEALEHSEDGQVYYDCYTDQDFGYAMVELFGGIEYMDKEILEMYFDYDAFGRDERINQSVDTLDGGIMVVLD